MKPLQNPHASNGAPTRDVGMEGRSAQAEFFARMGGSQQFQALFEHLPDVHFFAKDANGRFVAGSRGLLQRLGFSREEEFLGLTDADIHPARVAQEIREDDLRVMQTREPLVGRIEALFTRSQAKDWYVTTKLPIFGVDQEVIGIMGFVRLCRRDEKTPFNCDRIQSAITLIQKEYARAIPSAELARVAHLSVRQLNRLFQDVFGMSPQAFVVRTRVQAASDALLLTNKPLSDIATDAGFCDQSALSRRFSEHTGESPLKYRQRLQRVGRPAATEFAEMAKGDKKSAHTSKTTPLRSI